MENQDNNVEQEEKEVQDSKSFCVLPLKPCHAIVQREQEMSQIYDEMQRLKISKPNEVTAVVLSGIDGCGKTEMARQIGEKFYLEKSFDFVFTIDGWSMDTIVQSHADLANSLHCDKPSIDKICREADFSSAEKVIFLQALISTGIDDSLSWLIIIDDAGLDARCIFNDDNDWLKVAKQSTHGSGQLLIITDDNSCPTTLPDSHTFQLSLSAGMNLSDSVHALKQISGLLECKEDLSYVVKALDFQPLALACTAHFVQMTESHDDIWADCIKSIENTAKDSAGGTNEIPVKYAVSRLTDRDTVIRPIMQFLSFIAPSPIPVENVIKYCKNVYPNEDETDIKKLILANPLILSNNQGDIGLHRFVHRYIRDSRYTPDTFPFMLDTSPADRLKVLCDMAVTTFSNFTELDDAKGRIASRPLMVHAEYIANQIEEVLEDHPDAMDAKDNTLDAILLLGSYSFIHRSSEVCFTITDLCLEIESKYSEEEDEESAFVLSKLSDIYHKLNQTSRAIVCLQAVLNIKEEVYGQGDLKLADTLRKLAGIYFEEHQPEEAQDCWKRLIDIQRVQLDDKDPAIADSLLELGDCHKCVGELNKAKTCFEKALEIQQSAYHDEHPKLAVTLGLLSFVLFYLQRFEEAKSYSKQSLKIREAALGQSHPQVAKTLCTLGNILRNQSKFAEAKPHFQRALEIQANDPEKDQEQYATCLCNLGNITADLGQYEEGKNYLEQALEIKQRVYGDKDNSSFAMILFNLGSVYLKLKNSQALDFLERALKMHNNVHPGNHPDKVLILGTLGDALYHHEHLQKAQETLERALTMREQLHLGKGNVPPLLNNLSKVFKKLGKYQDAEECLENALAIQQSILHDDHPLLAITLVNLGGVCKDLGRFQEGRQYCERALHIQESEYGSVHPDVVDTRNVLGSILRHLGKYEEAKECLEKALEINNAITSSGNRASKSAWTLDNLGLVLTDLGQYEQAKKLLEQALEILKSTSNERNPNIPSVLGNLGVVLCFLEEYKQAKSVFEKVVEIDERLYDKKHPHLAKTLCNLSEVLRNLGELDKAKMCAERALEIKKTVFHENHPTFAYVFQSLGLIYSNLEQHKEARAFLEKAVAIGQSALGDNHPRTADYIYNLAFAYVKCNEYQQAKPLLERVMQIQQSTIDENHPSQACSLDLMAHVLKQLEQYEEARKYSERAVQIQKAAYGEKHPTVEPMLRNLGDILGHLGQHYDSKRCLDESENIKKTSQDKPVHT